MERDPYRYLGIMAWSGPLFLLASILAWAVLGHNLPPYSPARSPEEFHAFLLENRYQIQLGMILMMTFAPLYVMWGVAIERVMKAADPYNDVMATLQLWGAGLTMLVFFIPCGLWIGVTFRADSMDPASLRFMFDTAWMFFDTGFSPVTMQFVAFGVSFLSDRREVPLIPRWVSWLGIWVGVSFFVFILMPFFKEGPLARDGMLMFWIEFSLFFLFLLVASIYTIKAIGRLKAEAGQSIARAQ
ncbi:MAG: hypothetical protein AB7G24_10330 [Novosphingobium sp.]